MPERQQPNERHVDERQRQRELSPQGLYGPQRTRMPQFRLQKRFTRRRCGNYPSGAPYCSTRF